jgi:hypothetical protein
MYLFGGAVASSDEDPETFHGAKWRQDLVTRTLCTSNNLSTMTSYGGKVIDRFEFHWPIKSNYGWNIWRRSTMSSFDDSVPRPTSPFLGSLREFSAEQIHNSDSSPEGRLLVRSQKKQLLLIELYLSNAGTRYFEVGKALVSMQVDYTASRIVSQHLDVVCLRKFKKELHIWNSFLQ